MNSELSVLDPLLSQFFLLTYFPNTLGFPTVFSPLSHSQCFSNHLHLLFFSLYLPGLLASWPFTYFLAFPISSSFSFLVVTESAFSCFTQLSQLQFSFLFGPSSSPACSWGSLCLFMTIRTGEVKISLGSRFLWLLCVVFLLVTI